MSSATPPAPSRRDPDALKKRLRLGEFLVERAIQAVATLSLACIVLISLFIFKEAAPILLPDASATSAAPRNAAGSDTKGSPDGVPPSDSYGEVGPSESYGDEPTASETTGPPESYGDPGPSTASPASGTSPPAGDVGPSETYGEVGPSETYGDSTATAAVQDSSMTDSASLAAAPAPFEGVPGGHEGDEGEASLENLAGTDWQPVSLEPKYGILPLFVGSLKVTLIALLLAAPIAIFSALYTSTFASRWAKEVMKPVIEILAGVPSVVVGFFALVVLASVLQRIFGFDFRLNAFVGGVAMALAVIPIIFTISEDALAAIPKPLKEASLALGASKWETALFVVLPAATPGIFAAMILGFGRAFGETMIVLMATGNAALLSPDLFEPVRTMSATIGAEMAEVVFGDVHYQVLFLLGALLFLVSFTLNAVAEFFVRQRLLRRFKGS